MNRHFEGEAECDYIECPCLYFVPSEPRPRSDRRTISPKSRSDDSIALMTTIFAAREQLRIVNRRLYIVLAAIQGPPSTIEFLHDVLKDVGRINDGLRLALKGRGKPHP
jgi:hypothetical protein